MLASLLASMAAGEMTGIARRLKVAAAAYGVAAVLALAGCGFLLLAGFVLAADRWGAVGAATGFGLAFLALAGAMLLGLNLRGRAHRRRVLDAGRLAGTAAVVLLPSVLARRGGPAALLLPLLAVAGYAIWRENAAPDDGERG